MADKDGSTPLPRFEGAPPRLLLVAAPFYRSVVDNLVRGAAEVLDGFGAPYELIEVPGALEIAPAIGFAGRRFEGYVALGCVIRGETSHYETVCEESARGLTLLAVQRGFCIGNGILTCEDRAQAEARADPAGMDKGGGAAVAALHLVALARRFADPAPVSLREDGAAFDARFGG